MRELQTDNSIAVTLTNSFFELAALLEKIDDVCSVRGLDAEVRYCVRVIVEEMITNLIKYGYADNERHLIGFFLEIGSDHLLLKIEDDGVSFDPFVSLQHAGGRSGKDKAHGGHGLLMVKSMIDDSRYEQVNGKNLLTIWKRVRAG